MDRRPFRIRSDDPAGSPGVGLGDTASPHHVVGRQVATGFVQLQDVQDTTLVVQHEVGPSEELVNLDAVRRVEADHLLRRRRDWQVSALAVGDDPAERESVDVPSVGGEGVPNGLRQLAQPQVNLVAGRLAGRLLDCEQVGIHKRRLGCLDAGEESRLAIFGLALQLEDRLVLQQHDRGWGQPQRHHLPGHPFRPLTERLDEGGALRVFHQPQPLKQLAIVWHRGERRRAEVEAVGQIDVLLPNPPRILDDEGVRVVFAVGGVLRVVVPVRHGVDDSLIDRNGGKFRLLRKTAIGLPVLQPLEERGFPEERASGPNLLRHRPPKVLVEGGRPTMLVLA